MENDPATQSLTVPNANQVLWTRGGSSPECAVVTFELSTDGGATWTPLGTDPYGLGSRVGTTANWQLTGLSLSGSGQIRARGVTTGGIKNGSSGLVEAIASFNAPEIAVTGNAVDIADGDSTPDSADHTDFGPADPTGGAQVRTFTIANSGTAALTLGGVSVSGANAADFTVTAQPVSPVPPNGRTTFQVTFDPSALGLRTTSLSFTNNDGNENPFNFNIQGTGHVPVPGDLDPVVDNSGFSGVSPTAEIAVRGNAVNIPDGDITPGLTGHTDFGIVNLTGGTQVRTFTIANSGLMELTISNVMISGAAAADFTVTAQPVSPVMGNGGTTTFQVTFDPGAAGLREAVLSFSNNDPGENPFDFAIIGTGLNAPPVIGADAFDLSDGTPVARLAVADLLANDIDADLDALSITDVGDALPAGATVSLSGAFVVYSLPAGVSGGGSFTYTLSDGRGGHRVAGTVTLAVGRPTPLMRRRADVVAAFTGIPGRTYRVQYLTAFQAPFVWADFVPPATFTVPADGVIRHTDGAPDGTGRLYRAIPNP